MRFNDLDKALPHGSISSVLHLRKISASGKFHLAKKALTYLMLNRICSVWFADEAGSAITIHI